MLDFVHQLWVAFERFPFTICNFMEYTFHQLFVCPSDREPRNDAALFVSGLESRPLRKGIMHCSKTGDLLAKKQTSGKSFWGFLFEQSFNSSIQSITSFQNMKSFMNLLVFSWRLCWPTIQCCLSPKVYWRLIDGMIKFGQKITPWKFWAYDEILKMVYADIQNHQKNYSKPARSGQ